MRRALFLLVLCLIPAGLLAQTPEEDRGFLTRFLEDNLSGAGRTVRIDGFAGVLSSRATFDRLTIADAEGVWITIRDGAIQWNRSALLSGRVEVDELAAAEIVVERPPVGDEQSPTVAREFSLPDLPVSVLIGDIRADRIALGAALLGEPVEATFAGSLQLAAGEGNATFSASRIDGQTGRFDLAAAYSNATRVASIDLLAEEGAGGLAARAIGLPGEPAVALALNGSGPIDGFTADIALTTDGEPRLRGTIVTGASGPPEARERTFRLDLGGNVVPLFAPEYAAFFGEQVRLEAAGRRLPDGTTELSSLSLGAEALSLAGQLRIAPDGLPEFADLRLDLGLDGSRVLLPIPGEPTRVRSASLSFRFDASVSDDWLVSGRLNDLTRSDLSLRSVSLRGTGRIARAGATGAEADTVSGAFSFGLGGLALADPRLAEAFGSSLVGQIDFSWQRGDQLRVPSFSIAGDGFASRGDLRFFSLASALSVQGRVEANYADLGRLSALAGRPLAGSAALDVRGTAALLSGAFDLAASVRGRDLAVGQPELDRLLRGEATIDISAQRDVRGTEIRSLSVRAATLGIDASGMVNETDEDLTAQLRFDDLSVLGPAWRGAIRADATVVRSAGLRRIGLTGQATALRVGQPEADQLLAGSTDLTVALTERAGIVTIETLRLANPQLRAEARGEIGRGTGRATVEVRLADMALLVPGFPGPLSLAGDIRGVPQGYDISVTADGPGGTTARATGRLATSLATVDLAVSGQAQLGLLNPFIAPRNIMGPVSFDLRLDGPPTLSSLSGQVSTTGARLVAPNFNLALEGMAASADISGGTASVTGRASVDGGGDVSLSGSVGLTPPFTADLSIGLSRARLRDPNLYDTRVSGTLSYTRGAGGASRVAGDLFLNETEIRVPSTGLGAVTFAGEIIHVAEPAPVRATRARAGLVGETGAAAGVSGPPIALDIALSAPQRIFVRGRGLDAELGGTLRIGGTLDNIQPSGEFDLIRGRLDILGRRFDIDEGRVQLQGALVPTLFFVASTENDGVVSTITIEGPADEPEIRFSSSPTLPEEEVVAQLLFGRGLGSLSAFQAAQLASAIATLSGRGGEGIVGRLRSSFGLDDLDIQADDDGNVAVRAGKYLSQNLYTDVAVGGDGDAEITLNLDVSESVTVRGTLGSDGGTGLGIYYERDY